MTQLPALRLAGLRLAFLNATSSYDVPKLVRLRSKRLGAPQLASQRETTRLTLSARAPPRPAAPRSAAVPLRIPRGCVARNAGGARAWLARPVLTTGVTSRRAVLIYVGIYSLYVQKSYQAVSDFVAATEIRLQGYVSDAQNRVRLRGVPRLAPEADACAGRRTGLKTSAWWRATRSSSPPRWRGRRSSRGSAPAGATRVRPAPRPRRPRGADARCRRAAWDAATANGGEACASDEDCSEGRRSTYGVQTGACDASGFCMLRTWCPLDVPRFIGGRGGATSNATTTVSLSGAGDMQVSLYIAVRWVKFLSSDGRTEQWESPAGRGDPGSMFYTVSGLLDMAGVSYGDVAATGADVTLNFRFDCDWDLAQAKQDCRPDLHRPARLQPHAGAAFAGAGRERVALLRGAHAAAHHGHLLPAAVLGAGAAVRL